MLLSCPRRVGEGDFPIRGGAMATYMYAAVASWEYGDKVRVCCQTVPRRSTPGKHKHPHTLMKHRPDKHNGNMCMQCSGCDFCPEGHATPNEPSQSVLQSRLRKVNHDVNPFSHTSACGSCHAILILQGAAKTAYPSGLTATDPLALEQRENNPPTYLKGVRHQLAIHPKKKWSLNPRTLQC
jgi:hypothetical protein